MDIQSLLLVVHFQISLLYSPAQETSTNISEAHREAVWFALEPLSHMSKEGYYEVAAKGPSRLDRFCPRASKIIGQVILHWFDKVSSLSLSNFVHAADQAIYLRLVNIVKNYPGFAGCILDYDPSTINQLRPVLHEIISIITT
ncbi:hypothetical protein CT0861_12647 [Colletotrichum tofieldiae]|uniref:Uncharacterized protein n=1 Tax=Colletotrichum tofieldiae TaxID=708197 RepID=A0A166NQ62_9PEZI|nr:hypothetical protein CT0861_12647 [Colletotrichum tofieldiae]